MPPARLPNHHEEAQNGELVFLQHGVEFGDDGIKNLKHFVPFPQNQWDLFNGNPHHKYLRVYETVTSRVMHRQHALEAGAKTSHLRMRFLLPKDFGSFPASALKLITRRSADVTAYTIKLLKAGVADPSIDAVSIEPTVDATFEQKTLSPSGTYAAGDFLTFEIALTSSVAGQWCEFGDVEATYLGARGNV